MYVPVKLLINVRSGEYCKFGKFRKNNSIKRHICNVKICDLGHDLPVSVNDRVILPFREGLIFAKLRTCEVSQK